MTLDLLLSKLETQLNELLQQKWESTYYQSEKGVRETKSETPIELAVRLGYQDIVKRLLDAGDKTWLKDHRGMALIFSAVTGGHSKIVDILLEDQYGGSFDPEYKIDGVWCLHKAIIDANDTAVNILLTKIYDRKDALIIAKEQLKSKQSESDANWTKIEVEAMIRTANEYIKSNKGNILECKNKKTEKIELGKQKRILEQIENFENIVKALEKQRQNMKPNSEAIDKIHMQLKELNIELKENEEKKKQIEEETAISLKERLEVPLKRGKLLAKRKKKFEEELDQLNC